jgi:hypothetical protein
VIIAIIMLQICLAYIQPKPVPAPRRPGITQGVFA